MVEKLPLVSLWEGQKAVSNSGGKNESEKCPKNFQMSEQYWGWDKMSEVNFSPAETLQKLWSSIMKRFKLEEKRHTVCSVQQFLLALQGLFLFLFELVVIICHNL